MRVPDALIRAVCYPTSYRLTKLKRLEIPKKEATVVPVVNPIAPLSVLPPKRRRGTTYTYDQQKKQMILLERKGNLKNDDYRFFYGSAQEHHIAANCRWCDKVTPSPEARKNGHDACKFQLLQLYQRLKKDRNCAVCESRSSSFHWGVPLCSKECKDAFKFENPHPLVWERNEMKRTLVQ